MINYKIKNASVSREVVYIPLEDSSVVFTTYDLGVSTALLCAGFELLSVDKENSKKALFVFKKEDGIEGVANLYWSDRLEVKARSYFDHFKALKNKLYSE
jgi:hypothetical protein